ncbi:MAG TPA: PadR family transcriptional regulator [Ktedonobacterales bacterium]|nr:PadR family transcriptional regulator [Ktedonobacterales bacterium]
MTRTGREPDEFLPLTPAVFHILLALADSERHGYGIMRDIAERTQGSVRMGPGTLYGTIQRMLADGLIVVADERPDPAHDDERRRYYRLSDLGLRVARAEALRLERLVRLAQAKRVLYGPELMGGA